MGYTLKIGEAVMYYDTDIAKIDCELIRKDDAPAFGELTDYENQRWPSYSSWAAAIQSLDMMDVMFNYNNGGKGVFTWEGVEYAPLLECHPGATPITKAHVEYVESKLATYKAKHPDHIAQFPPLKAGAVPVSPGSEVYPDDQYSDDPTYDGNLCRGEWLAYWLRWALRNCKRPIFVNS